MTRSHRTVPAAVLAALLSAAGCAPAGAAQQPPAGPSAPGAPAAPATPDPGAAAAALQRATAPSSPRTVRFAWRLDEAGAGFRGNGLARYAAPGRIRLDLFGPRGETYLAAALVDGDARVPASVEERFKLPSSVLLWGALGIFVPPPGARLASSAVDGDAVTLRFEGEGGEVHEVRARADRLVSIRRLVRGGVQESLEVEQGAQPGVPRRSTYRDWPAYRSLTLTLESSADVASFPEDTWTPPGTGR
jgi:hypothetical protein